MDSMLKPARKWAGFYIFEKTYALKPRYLIFFLLVTLFKVTFCQVSEFDKTRAISSFNLQDNTLNFWPHNDTLIALKKGLFQNIEVDALFSLKGSKNWHWAYKLPQVGVSLNYYNFGNNKVLGNGLGVYPFMILKLAKSSKLDLNFRYGGGIVYIAASIINVNNKILSNGGSSLNPKVGPSKQDGDDGKTFPYRGSGGSGGGGAGGSILLIGNNLSLGESKVTATGGVAASPANVFKGGDGGFGRIRIEYVTGFSGVTSPTSSNAKIN